MKRGREYHGCDGKNITWKKERGRSNIIFPIILGLLGRISSWEKGKGTEVSWKKVKIKKIAVEKKINIIHGSITNHHHKF